jgi:uncharacterized protein
MSSTPQQQDDQRVARALGLKVPVYRRLRDAIDRGESLAWLRLADPGLAGVFPNPLGFELLIEHLEVEVALERRRANLLRTLEGKDLPEMVEAVRAAASEGELEDLQLSLEPSPAPAEGEAPEKEEHQVFLAALRGDAAIATALRTLFREQGEVRVEVAEGKQAEAKRYQTLAEGSHKLADFGAAAYLPLRRAEHAHVLKLQFDLPRPELDRFFDAHVENAPPQERDAYLKLFADFFAAERLPRLVQEARARLKRQAESLALQQAWPQLENALDRGRHDGSVLGMFAHRNGKVVLALLDRAGHFQRAATVSAKAPDLAEKVAALLGEEKPGLVALQADSPTRNHGNAVLDAVRAVAGRPRTTLVPVAVAKTLLREVARRLEEAHLSHDERQAALLARLGHHPRAAALHTPHIVRSYVAFRGEINSRRLDAFETIFLQSMLAARGVDLNTATHDELRLVPGLDARTVELERATGPFRSLADFQGRLALPENDWRAAGCFLRVREGDQPFDARPLHPVYYAPLALAAQAAGLDPVELLRDPAKVDTLDWKPIGEERGWSPKVVDLIRRSLVRGVRRPRRTPPRAQGTRLEALEVGAKLPGRITKLVEHGAFVDVGARREGFVHVSELADQFVKEPGEVVQEGQEVTARVLSIDLEKQRFRLSLREPGERPARGGGRGEGRGEGGKGRGEGGKGRGRGPRRQEPAEPALPAHVRSTRPKSRRPAGRPGRDEKRREERIVIGKDPLARKKEEIDPTNPFFQFFQAQKETEDDGGEG